MKKLCIVIALVLALSCFAIAAFAADITPQTIIASASISVVPDFGLPSIAGAAIVVLGLSAASVVVLRRK